MCVTSGPRQLRRGCDTSLLSPHFLPDPEGQEKHEVTQAWVPESLRGRKPPGALPDYYMSNEYFFVLLY